MVFALVRPSVPNATCCRGRVADITPELPPLPAGGRVCTDVKEGDDVSAAPVFAQVSPFLIGRMFLREASWKYSAKLVGS